MGNRGGDVKSKQCEARKKKNLFLKTHFLQEKEDYLTFITKSFPFGVFLFAEHSRVELHREI